MGEPRGGSSPLIRIAGPRDELRGGDGLSQARSSVWIDRAHDASRSLGLRLRFTGALLLLILPLGAAAWAFGNYAASNERERTDARLDASLRAAASEYGRVVDDAQLRAIQLASQPRVQRALRDRSRGVCPKLPGTVKEIRKAQRVNAAFQQVLDHPQAAEILQHPALQPLLDEAAD